MIIQNLKLKTQNFNHGGFTLIELLIVIGIAGVLTAASVVIFVITLQNQNKTVILNEIRQNGNFVIERFEREIRSSSNVAGGGLAISYSVGDEVRSFGCDLQDIPGNSNGRVFIETVGSSPESLTNQDTQTGVSVLACSFGVSGTSPQTARFKVTLGQGVDLPANRPEFQAQLEFETTVATRVY